MNDRAEQTATELQRKDISDFTSAHYSELLQLAKASYRFVGYDEVRQDRKVILWRHDCDVSLNRALRLAMIERDHSVISTFFLNPHCEFYNLLEKEQTRIVRKIISLGHRIGLHFDAAYYELESEDDLARLVSLEAKLLRDWFGADISAFSFHNPTEFLLSCDKDTYGGLVNCYSRAFRSTVPYCSDSNGYWRFHRLWDVLQRAQDPCLQVLTHPEWWQETPMYPRERISRSVYGRAKAVLAAYDQLLETHGRRNYSGPAEVSGQTIDIQAEVRNDPV
jgi:hypothetical protein